MSEMSRHDERSGDRSNRPNPQRPDQRPLSAQRVRHARCPTLSDSGFRQPDVQRIFDLSLRRVGRRLDPQHDLSALFRWTTLPAVIAGTDAGVLARLSEAGLVEVVESAGRRRYRLRQLTALVCNRQEETKNGRELG